MAEQSSCLQEEPSAPANGLSNGCQVCNESMSEGQDCLIISQCLHSFHRDCIESHLSNSAQCPVCQHPCQLNELRNYVVTPKRHPLPKQSKRGKGRGAMARTYNTRSASRNLFQDMQNTSFSNDVNPHPEQPQVSTQNNNYLNNDNFVLSPLATNVSQTVNPPAVDYTEINRMIETSISRILQNLKVTQNPSRINNTETQPFIHNSGRTNNPLINHPLPCANANISHNQNQNIHQDPISNNNGNVNHQFNPYPTANQPDNLSSSATNFNSIPADKVTSIINNWNLKFDGSANGLNIDEFLYRVRTLTNDNFCGDFSVICKNLNTLLAGKAREWFWRYHKLVQSITWEDFCKAIRAQYKDMKTSFDLREELRNRKQKPGESYDNFFDALSTIADRFPSPMSEEEFIEIIARNLRPEIRQDLLYVPIYSLAHLRKLVQMRENFLSDEYVRKTLSQRGSIPNPIPRRLVSELDQDPIIDSEQECLVDAVQNGDSHFKCWNCDSSGHHWQDCLETRSIFCYGCGTKNVYKPQCTKCITRNQNSSKNLRTVGPQKDQV